MENIRYQMRRSAINCHHKITEELSAVSAMSEHRILVGRRLSTLKSRNVSIFLIIIKNFNGENVGFFFLLTDKRRPHAPWDALPALFPTLRHGEV